MYRGGRARPLCVCVFRSVLTCRAPKGFRSMGGFVGCADLFFAIIVGVGRILFEVVLDFFFLLFFAAQSHRACTWATQFVGRFLVRCLEFSFSFSHSAALHETLVISSSSTKPTAAGTNFGVVCVCVYETHAHTTQTHTHTVYLVVTHTHTRTHKTHVYVIHSGDDDVDDDDSETHRPHTHTQETLRFVALTHTEFFFLFSYRAAKGKLWFLQFSYFQPKK